MTREWTFNIFAEYLDDIERRGKRIEVRALPENAEEDPNRDYRAMRPGHSVRFVEVDPDGESRIVYGRIEAVRAYFSFEELYETEDLSLTEPRLKTSRDAVEETEGIESYAERMGYWREQGVPAAYAIEFRLDEDAIPEAVMTGGLERVIRD